MISLYPISTARPGCGGQSARSPRFGSQSPQSWTEHLHLQATQGNIYRLHELLKTPHNLNQPNPYTAKTALMLAAENDRPDAIRLLLSKGAQLE